VRSTNSLTAWLYGVAVRVAFNARRTLRRRPMCQKPLPDDVPDSRPAPPVQLLRSELLAALEEEVQRLPQAYRLPVALCCLEGLTQEETARRLGWKPGSVKARLERGRARLRERLVRRGLAPAAVFAALESTRES